ncbi:MAG: elongation factor P, partial [Nitrospirota bacterium]|nr:elongation factor P [Nitrospirota bacterium]
MITTSDFRNGSRLELDKVPYYIVEFQHVKPGKGGAFVRTKLKNLKTGQVLDRTFRPGEKFTEPNLDECDMQFLYSSGDEFSFMDTSSYEQ